MLRVETCSEDVKDLLAQLRLSGRALAIILGVSTPSIFRWIDGTAAPAGTSLFAIRALASAVRAASPEECEQLRAIALSTPGAEGLAFQALLTAAISMQVARKAAPVQAAQTAVPAGRLVIFRARKNRAILAGPGLLRSVSLGAEGGRRARRLAGPLTRRIG